MVAAAAVVAFFFFLDSCWLTTLWEGDRWIAGRDQELERKKNI